MVSICLILRFFNSCSIKYKNFIYTGFNPYSIGFLITIFMLPEFVHYLPAYSLNISILVPLDNFQMLKSKCRFQFSYFDQYFSNFYSIVSILILLDDLLNMSWFLKFVDENLSGMVISFVISIHNAERMTNMCQHFNPCSIRCLS